MTDEEEEWWNNLRSNFTRIMKVNNVLMERNEILLKKLSRTTTYMYSLILINVIEVSIIIGLILK